MTDVRKGKGREFGRETAGEGEERRGTPARTLFFSSVVSVFTWDFRRQANDKICQ